MNPVYADTFYWIALSDARDGSHGRARELDRTLRHDQIVTTQEVLVEFLTFYGEGGGNLRGLAVSTVDGIIAARYVEVIPQSAETFDSGLNLYRSRLDKGYSMTDCISMETMRRMGIREALTHDQHFRQEGFVTLL